MTQLRDLFDGMAGSTPPSSLSAATVYAAGRRRHTSTVTARTALSATTAVALGVAVYATAGAGGPVDHGGPSRDRAVLSVVADGDHRYAAVADCPISPSSAPWQPDGPSAYPSDVGYPSGSAEPAGYPSESAFPSEGAYPTGSAEPSDYPSAVVYPSDSADPTVYSSASADPDGCKIEILGSDDAGSHWTVRTKDPVVFGKPTLAVPAPGVLLLLNPGGSEPRFSQDGGRSWRLVTATETPVPRVPVDGWAVDSETLGAGYGLLSVDPVTGSAAPLAHQPQLNPPCANPFCGFQVREQPNDVIIAWTFEGEFSISRDGGASWSAPHRVPGTRRAFDRVRVSKVDGRTLYYIDSETDGGVEKVTAYSSDDDGATWQHRVVYRSVTPTSSSDTREYPPASLDYIATDGSHVIIVRTTDPARSTTVASKDGGKTYRPATVAGPPLAVLWPGGAVDVMPVGGYVATWYLSGAPTYYYSADGWSWQRVAVS